MAAREGCLSWPCPDLTCFPCVTGFSVDQFSKFLDQANQVAFRESGSLFGGCDCVKTVRPCVPCACVNICSCDPCFVDRIDLCEASGGLPVNEILYVEIDGVEQDLDCWWVQESRWLCTDQYWPAQNQKAQLGDECTWAVTFSYGEEPPAELLYLRDKYLYELLDECFNRDKKFRNVSRVRSKDVTYDYSSEASALQQIIARFGCRPEKVGYVVDPDDHVSRPGVSFVEARNPEQFEAVYDACDVEALIDMWVESQNPVVDGCIVPIADVDEYGLPV